MIKPNISSIALSDALKLRLRSHKLYPRETDEDCLSRVLNQLESIEPSTINKSMLIPENGTPS